MQFNYIVCHIKDNVNNKNSYTIKIIILIHHNKKNKATIPTFIHVFSEIQKNKVLNTALHVNSLIYEGNETQGMSEAYKERALNKDYHSINFEDFFLLLLDLEYSRRKRNKLYRLIESASSSNLG